MDSEKIQAFLIAHAEKAVVAVVVAVSGWMVYSGLQMESILTKHQPERLATDAQTVRSSIDEDHSAEVLQGREPTFDIVQETLVRQRPVDPSPYALPNLLERRSIDSSIRRSDPTLLAPAKLQVSGHIASIALLSSSGNYALKDLEGAEALEVVEKKPKVQPRQNRRRNMMDMDGMGMDGMDGMMEMEMEMEMMMMEESMMGPMMGGGTATPSGRAFSADGDFGVRPTGKDGKQPVPRPGWFIAGTAVVPHKSISESYRSALADADGYLPMRDQPLYYNYEVQRADITDKSVDQLAEADWILVRNREQDLIRAATQWAGFAPELVPDDFRDVNITAYIPPILLKDYSKFVLHPDIPMVSRRELEMEEAKEMAGATEEVKADDLEMVAPGAMGGMGMGMGGMMEMGFEMDMGMGMGYGGMMQVEEDPVDYKLMRFFDFASGRDKNSPRGGRTYVYRMRYSINDPNFPANPIQQPKVSTLSRDVYDRVQQLMVAAESTGKRDFQRWSDWSEPSGPVSLPPLNEYFAGPVVQPRARMIDVGGKRVPLAREQPNAKMVNYALNLQYGANMPIWMEKVVPGSTMSFEGEAEAIDPIELKVKKVPEAKVLSQTTVIGIDGGQSLGMKDANDEELTRPSLMLIYDENGSLRVTGEVQDQEMYRIYSFANERGL